ncbi:MAG: ribonuclease III [Bacteroidetes bacterium]|nr:ribonuclease III [Bacteroidota bacterium]
MFKRLFSKTSANEKILREKLKKILGFSPNDISIYQSALKHISTAGKRESQKGQRDSNERLEFLGDAILGSIIADHLFKLFPDKDEGFLSKMRSRIVSRNSLNQLSTTIGLSELVEVSVRREESVDIYGNALEALVGAVYLDRGFVKSRDFILKNLVDKHIDINEVVTTEDNYKSRIIEWGQKNKRQVLFELVREEGQGLDKLFYIRVKVDNQVMAETMNRSKKKAEQLAAEIASFKLEI